MDIIEANIGKLKTRVADILCMGYKNIKMLIMN